MMRIKKILIGIDDSKFAEHAAAYGFDIAHAFKAEVGLVHIVEPMVLPNSTNADFLSGPPIMETGINDVELIKIQNDAAETLIERTIKKFAGDLAVTHFNEYGDTADGIINCSKQFGADLIVVGTHTRSGFDRLLMGSIAEHVVRHAQIPVLVIPFEHHSS